MVQVFVLNIFKLSVNVFALPVGKYLNIFINIFLKNVCSQILFCQNLENHKNAIKYPSLVGNVVFTKIKNIFNV